ncbi:MAG: ATP-binding protein [Candidatus Helarchaeota archaeon]
MYQNYITPTILIKNYFTNKTIKKSNRTRKKGKKFHLIWEKFNKNFFYAMKKQKNVIMKKHDFEKLLFKIRTDVYEEFKTMGDPQEASKFLHNLIEKIRRIARRNIRNSKISIDNIIMQYFGGTPEFEKEIEIEIQGFKLFGKIDQLVLTKENEIIIKDLKPRLFDYNEDTSQNPHFFQIALYGFMAELYYKRKCKKIILIDYNLDSIEIMFTRELRSHISQQISNYIKNSKENIINTKNLAYNQNSVQNNDKNSSEINYNSNDLKNLKIGWCIARRNKKPALSIRSNNKIEGYIEDSKKLDIHPGIYVVIDFSGAKKSQIPEDMNNVRIISRIIQIKPYKETISIIKNSAMENVIEVELEPIFEISENDGYIGKVRPHIFDDATIRFCTDDEIIELLQIPYEGFEIARIDGYGDRNIKYRLSYSKISESICILGTQGTGKTTSIYGMVLKFVGDKKLDKQKRPSVVILDIESEYLNFGKYDFKIANQGFYYDYNISEDIQLNIYKIGYEKDCYTLDFSLLEPEDYIYFIPDLTSRTAEAFISIATDIKDNLEKCNNFTKENLLSGVLEYVQSDLASYLHPSTIQAIIRACNARYFDLFDRQGCKKLNINDLLNPGNLSVIDVFDLPDQQQRIIGLYLMLVFYRYKMKMNNGNDNNLLLIIDEAHRIFPKNSKISSEKDYINRIISKVNEITHRGRKRRYGILFATQNPADLNKEIITTCNTKIFFRIIGENIILKEILNNFNLREIKKLPTGTAIISCHGIHDPLRIQFPNLKIKNIN